MSAQAVRFNSLRSLAFGSISGTYAAVGTQLGHQIRILKFVNNTNADLTVSFDGTTDNDFVPANSFCLYDLQTNAATDYNFMVVPSTIIYVKGAPGSGSFYVVSAYGQGQ